MPSVDLANRPIVITGASSGIGAATAVACAQSGMPIGLFARRHDKLEAVANRITEAGGRAIVVVGSVETPGDCLRLLDETEAAFGPVYAAFANAGYGQESASWSMPDADIRRMFEVNFFGSMNLLRPAIDRFVRAGEGHALMCSSCLAKLGLPYYGCYGATKACQDHFGRAMRHELRPQGVSVSTIHPIGTKTEFFTEMEARSAGGPGLSSGSDRFMQTPQRVARAVVKQLGRGRGAEVWTSLPARLGFAGADAFPALTDWVIAKALRNRLTQQPDGDRP